MIKDSNDLIVYHGSIYPVKNVNFKFSRKHKDFGKGFYLTTDRKQAIKFARIKAIRSNSKISYLNIFCIKDFKDLIVKEFVSTNSEWLDCIVGNRLNIYSHLCENTNKCDVIIGKIADDTTSFVLNAYIKGVYGDIESKESKKTVIKMLKCNLLKDQICLKTIKSIKKLKYIGYEEISNDKK